MSNLINSTKKAVMAAAAVATLATGVTVATSGAAEAQWRGKYAGGGYGYRPGRAYGYGGGYRGYRGARGGGVAAGIIGGLAAGALIAGATNAYSAPYSYGYGGVPVYGPSYGYAPAYHGGAYAYEPACYTRRVRQIDDWGRVLVRRVRVCE